MNIHYKLLVTDIDGTLVDKQGKISDIDRLALAEVRRAGIKVSLCTGRATRGSLWVLKALSLDNQAGGFHIFFDGALVCNADQSEVVYSRPLPAGYVKQVCDFARDEDLTLELFTILDFFISRDSLPARVHSELMQYRPAIRDFESICGMQELIMGCFVVRSSGEEEEKVRVFASGLKDKLRFSWTKHPAYPEYLFINVTLPDVSKGKAFNALVSYLGLDRELVIAIGDGSNDVSLLEAAGLAVAMENSPSDLKAVADYIAPDIDHHGLSHTIHRFLFE